MYSDFSNTIDGAGHTRRDDLKSSREAADTTLDVLSGEFGRVGRVFLAALQNSKFFSKWGYFYTIFKCF